MTYIIGEACIDVKDISCQSVCPVDCIHETDRMLVIDAEECIDCGACEPECPVEAILPEDAIPDDWEPFVKINYAFSLEKHRPARSRSTLVQSYADEKGIVPDAARTSGKAASTWPASTSRGGAASSSAAGAVGLEKAAGARRRAARA